VPHFFLPRKVGAQCRFFSLSRPSLTGFLACGVNVLRSPSALASASSGFAIGSPVASRGKIPSLIACPAKSTRGVVAASGPLPSPLPARPLRGRPSLAKAYEGGHQVPMRNRRAVAGLDADASVFSALLRTILWSPRG